VVDKTHFGARIMTHPDIVLIQRHTVNDETGHHYVVMCLEEYAKLKEAFRRVYENNYVHYITKVRTEFDCGELGVTI
jgi:hypothetical protein